MPLTGDLADDALVIALVWGPVSEDATLSDFLGTPLDLDLRVTFLADEATGEHCLVSARARVGTRPVPLELGRPLGARRGIAFKAGRCHMS